MAKSKKNKPPKGKKAFKQGYVSFTPEDLEKLAAQDTVNGAAYGFLDQAMTTSSHITETDTRNLDKGGTVDIDDVYPVSLEETLEMEALLDKAQAAAGNPSEPFFAERLGELRGIVEWSKKRHWNFSWIIIVGVLVSVFILFQIKDSRKKEVRTRQVTVDKVEAWTEMDTTFTLKNMELTFDQSVDAINNKFTNANLYKLYLVDYFGSYHYYRNMSSAESYSARADTSSTKENKKNNLKWAKECEEAAEKNLKEFNKYNDMDYEEVKEVAMDEAKDALKEAKRATRKVGFWALFFLFCIPVYIFADRPYGYLESRHRAEAKVLGGIKKWGFAIAGLLAGTALATEYVPDTIVKTRWSDGSTTTHTETDPSNYFLIAIKLCLYAVAIIIVCAVSCFIMVYSTVSGLMRNYNWTPVIDKARTMVKKEEKAE